MKSINSIRKITKTMEMVSVTKMKRANFRAHTGRAYIQSIGEILQSIGRERVFQHPLIQMRPNGKRLILVIASDKGLCGGYNTLIYRSLLALSTQGSGSECVTLGKYADKQARRARLPIIASFPGLPELYDDSSVLPMVKYITDLFLHSNEYKTIEILSEVISQGISYAPVQQIVLPLHTTLQDITDTNNQTEEYIFEPSVQSVLDSILPDLVLYKIMHAVALAKSAEHTARMVAMKSATDNANNYYNALTLSYNRVRQAGITQEIAEIVSGANALSE